MMDYAGIKTQILSHKLSVHGEGGEPWMTQGGPDISLLGGRVCCS